MKYKVVVSYDGYGYAGWQKQENALGIQQVIEDVFFTILQKETVIVASGRTDAGVHAFGQVFHFESNADMDANAYKKALNAMLPKDIRIQSVELVDDDFHARFDAKSKRYDYICTYDRENPFIYKYKEVLLKPVNLNLMKEASLYLLGEHDFTSFSSSRIDPRKPRIKTITKIEILEEGKDIHFIYEGNGFLRYQVRMMTQTLLMVGIGRIQVEDVKRILEAKDKEACKYNASSCGLYLVKVNY